MLKQSRFTEYTLTKYQVLCFTFIISPEPYDDLQDRYSHYSRFTDEETIELKTVNDVLSSLYQSKERKGKKGKGGREGGRKRRQEGKEWEREREKVEKDVQGHVTRRRQSGKQPQLSTTEHKVVMVHGPSPHSPTPRLGKHPYFIDFGNWNLGNSRVHYF